MLLNTGVRCAEQRWCLTVSCHGVRIWQAHPANSESHYARSRKSRIFGVRGLRWWWGRLERSSGISFPTTLVPLWILEWVIHVPHKLPMETGDGSPRIFFEINHDGNGFHVDFHSAGDWHMPAKDWNSQSLCLDTCSMLQGTLRGCRATCLNMSKGLTLNAI